MGFLQKQTTFILLMLGAMSEIFGQPAVQLLSGREVVSNEILIRFKSKNADTVSSFANVLAEGDSIRVLHQDLGLAVVHSSSQSVAALLAAFASRSDIAYAEPNYVIHASSTDGTTTPNDPAYNQLWALQKTGAPAAWKLSSGSASAVVGIIDTGVAYDHPDLAANMWSAPSAFTVNVDGKSISCPAGSHGLDAVHMNCDPMDGNGHGTHVAGTIGAVGNNAIGVTGMNWSTNMMAFKIFEDNGYGVLSSALRAINFAVQVKRYFANTNTPLNLRVLSNSWGGAGFSQALLDAIDNVGKDDILFVAAAGNEGLNVDVQKVYPASAGAANQITVAATDQDDNLAGFSSYGTGSVHLGAPGVAILSTFPGSGYGYMSGTSMATPHVSGAAMLVLSLCPSLDTLALKNVLLSSAAPAPALAGKTMSGGRLNVNGAMQIKCSPLHPALSTLTLNSETIQSGQTALATITLNTPAGLGGLMIRLSSSNPAAVSVPPTVIIPQGSASATVSFTAGNVAVMVPFTLTATAYDVSKTASGIIVPSQAEGMPFLTGFALNAPVLRNNFTGWVGMKMTTGKDSLHVKSIGRICVTGNSGSHRLKLVRAASGLDVPEGLAVVTMAGCTPGQFAYAPLAEPVLLAPQTSYYVLTEETLGSDRWYDFGSIKTTSEATVNGAVYQYNGSWYVANAPNTSYSPPNFTYTLGPADTVAVTVKTAPGVGSITVDGVAYDSGHIFNWTRGSSHSLGIASPQSLTTDTRLVWASWNDGGAMSHLVSPTTDSEYVANFKTQYLLATTVMPVGTGTIVATPPSSDGYYDAGATVQVSAVPGESRSFGGWSGDLSGSAFAQTVLMTGPRAVTATFASVGGSGAESSLITGYGLSGQPLRNNFSGWLGMKLTLDRSVLVSTIGRLCVSGNNGIHTVKLVNASTNQDVPGSAVSVNMTSCIPGQFQFAPLAAATMLEAGGSYYLVSQESNGGDRWYDTGQIATTSEGRVNYSVYSNDGLRWTAQGGLNASYGPSSFQYTLGPADPKPPFIRSFDPRSTLRNNYTGWVGMKLTVSTSPIIVSSLGRLCIAGNSNVHTLKIVEAKSGVDVSGSSVKVSMASCNGGQFVYTPLNAPIMLQPNDSYYLVSEETSGKDRWNDFGAVSSSAIASVNGAVWGNSGQWNVVGNLAVSYVPPNFK